MMLFLVAVGGGSGRQWAGGGADGRYSVGFGGKKSAIEIDSSIWREEIGNGNLLGNLAGRIRQ